MVLDMLADIGTTKAPRPDRSPSSPVCLQAPLALPRCGGQSSLPQWTLCLGAREVVQGDGGVGEVGFAARLQICMDQVATVHAWMDGWREGGMDGWMDVSVCTYPFVPWDF